MNSYALNPGI